MNVMIGKLKSVNVRTVHEKKVVRVTLDFPYNQLDLSNIDSDSVLQWLNKRVDNEIGVDFLALTETDQEALDDE